MRTKMVLASAASAISILAAALLPQNAVAANGDTLKTVQDRGQLVCTGHNGSFEGFAEVDDKGNWKGFDIDYCRAIAAAIFGDANKVNFLPVSWAQRFPSLQSGELDVVIKATGWTMSRDTELGLQFSVPYFLGLTQVMVPKSLGVEDVKGLDGGTACVEAGTSTERQAANYFKRIGVDLKLITFEKTTEARSAYFGGRCDSFVQWGPNLATARLSAPNPDEHMILPDNLALEAEAAVVRQGDDPWLDIVNWTFFTTWIAEEYGITSENVDEMKANPPDETVAKLLGVTPGFGSRLGLSDDAGYNIIKLVGNSEEIYERSLGEGSPYKLPRGLNNLWNNGGVLYPAGLD
ncbi:amino acid ABC transporter substrate-binding protein [Falsochrobactrum sp. TDYN1]|uniref:Amino acid ABC transporter substrate-binding protein n=1 Tax=Falsochrobactrum tianjinense TaxID=2706015 RepID=A0A949PP13_9HYPH|nr:amino acid ABC transporter substrate-binding protein [Falsochrobactrum sp. TDYN1]MBV2143411.1 amino acid ABC transporter substrate-binding protein [Falsochrobactrum sp. TDYN1]